MPPATMTKPACAIFGIAGNQDDNPHIGRLMISLLYRSFGKQPPEHLAGFRLAVTWIVALGFAASSVLMLTIFNFFSLFFGVFVNFLGRDGVKFTFIQLFGRIPVIGFAPVILIGFAIWQNYHLSGLLAVVAMPLLTAVAAVALMGGVVWVNTMVASRRNDADPQDVSRPTGLPSSGSANITEQT